MAEEHTEQAATRVREAAANIHQAPSPRERISGDRAGGEDAGTSEAETVARRYFEAINAHDLDAAVGMWAPGGREHVRGQIDAAAPEGVRAFIGDLIGAMPDLCFELVSTTTAGERCAVQWRLKGTFVGPGTFGGLRPTGHPLTLEGVDVLTVRDGLIQANDAFPDSMAVPRQIGMLPPQGSTAEQRMMGAFNVKTRLSGRLLVEPELIAEGVWVLKGQPGPCNVYFIEDDGGVTMYDAGARAMVRSVAAAGAKLGGIKRIVLGHGHTDHRGTAPALGVPVYCHAEEVQDAEGSGGFRYWPEGLAGLPAPQRQIHRALHRFAWDGGPVEIAGTLAEGDEVAGFRVHHFPGHAPGLIGLWRESDRLALASDTFYTIDMWGRDTEPKVPVSTYNYDTAQARQSIRKLAEMEPAIVWTGHAKPASGSDVRTQLERAADAP
ncbi:MAG TPA: MBL fold metallo-hydrolase [Solirubrobacteraceae bacterium]|jgi:hydroxyacylglutathione hydrolase|nr:MBL fold metallo-hydrolase [Solirubrobacteraceae bacterium]